MKIQSYEAANRLTKGGKTKKQQTFSKIHSRSHKNYELFSEKIIFGLILL